MPSWFRSVFGKSAAKRLGEAERLAAIERWPEAIDILRTALAEATDEEGEARSEIPRRIAAYTDSYLGLLREAIERCVNEGDREKAEELASVALAYATSEEKKGEIRSLLERAAAKAPAAEEADVSPDECPVNEPFGDELIDSLLYGYAESLEPGEREEILKRPFSFQKAFVLYQQGDVEGAARAAREYVSKTARDPYGHLYLGIALDALGESEEAIHELETARVLDPDLWQAAFAIAEAERRRGAPARAAEHLEEAMRALRAIETPEGERAREHAFHGLFEVLLETGRSARAEELYRDLLSKKLLPEALPVEARLAEARGDAAAAAERWEAFLRSSAGQETIMGRGTRAATAGAADIEEAADFYSRSENPKRALDLYERAALLVTQRIHFSGERMLLPHLFRLKKKMALLLVETGRAKDASKIAEEMESEAPASPDAAEIRRAIEAAD
ncbi:MAG: hypothetical protein EHM19_02105 [Candidatus Latescibacterota bacterium]|nr:MAG: hypothetical protein EHM19_02105 [Candidatus Latescibacterota bacterium]